jgi:Xaa-Pro aminopeptidase
MINIQENRFWESPLYADFPRSEFDHRVQTAKKYMERQKIDVMVLWDKNNIRYFSGFNSLHWTAMSIQPAVLLIPLDKDPVIVVPDFFGPVAEGQTYIKDIRAVPEPHLTKNIRNLPVDIADTVKSLGFAKGRIGIESGSLGGMCVPRPINDIDLFRNSLNGAIFVDACDLIWDCRMIKSACEVEAITKATHSIIEAYGKVISGFYMGMTEREVGILLTKAIIENAHECEPPIATASARRIPMPDVASSYDGIPILEGDRIVFEPLPTYKGYTGSCCRCMQVGELSDEEHRMTDLVDRAQAASFSEIKPGVKTKVLVEAIKKTFEEEGVGLTIEMAGHSVGLTGHEPPMLTEHEDRELKEGMVLAVEVWQFDFTGASYRNSTSTDLKLTAYGNEDLVVVTKDGFDPLPSLPKHIRSLPVRSAPC